MEDRITKMLDDMNIPVIYKGYYYWIELIMHVYKRCEKIEKFTDINMTELYKKIADIFDTTPASVERNLRTSIENRSHYIKQYFNKQNNITSKMFLILCVKKLKERN